MYLYIGGIYIPGSGEWLFGRISVYTDLVGKYLGGQKTMANEIIRTFSGDTCWR